MIFTALALSLAVEASPLLIYPGRENQLKVAVPRLDESIEIDGRLDEAAWAGAAHLTAFSQYAPTDGRPAEQDTEVLVFYSPSAIHFGVRAKAPAGSVRAASPSATSSPPKTRSRSSSRRSTTDDRRSR